MTELYFIRKRREFEERKGRCVTEQGDRLVGSINVTNNKLALYKGPCGDSGVHKTVVSRSVR